MRALSLTRRVFAFVSLLFVAACSGGTPTLAPPPDNVARKATITDVPLIEQADFYCGPASLAMVFQWGGLDITQAEVAGQTFSPGARGTFQTDMIGAARRQGFLAVPVRGFEDLTREVAAGHPIIVFQNLQFRWAPVWHYAVVTGYDLGTGTVTLHSGELARVDMSLEEFGRTWGRGDNWALLVLPPDDLPVSSRERDVLDAAAGLERAGRVTDAAAAYRAGAARWPQSWLWQFALGNALFAGGDVDGARRAYEQAIRLDPTAPEPRQNLARLNSAS